MAHKRLIERVSRRISERDVDIIYRNIVLGQSWREIGDAYGLEKIYTIKARFETLAEDRQLLQNIVAEESIKRQKAASESAAKEDAELQVPEDTETSAERTPLTAPISEMMTKYAAPESAEADTNVEDTITDQIDKDVESDLEEDAAVDAGLDTEELTTKPTSSKSPFLENTANKPSATRPEHTHFWEPSKVEANPNPRYVPPSPYVAPTLHSTIFGKHSVTDYNRDLITPMREVITAYLNLFGPLSLNSREALYETLMLIRERSLPVEWLKEAVIVVGKKVPEKRTMGYIIGLVRNWCTKGRGVLDSQTERSTVDFIRKQMGYLYTQEMEREIIKDMGLYGPVATIIKMQETLAEFNISSNIITAFRKNISTSETH